MARYNLFSVSKLASYNRQRRSTYLVLENGAILVWQPHQTVYLVRDEALDVVEGVSHTITALPLRVSLSKLHTSPIDLGRYVGRTAHYFLRGISSRRFQLHCFPLLTCLPTGRQSRLFEFRSLEAVMNHACWQALCLLTQSELDN